MRSSTCIRSLLPYTGLALLLSFTLLPLHASRPVLSAGSSASFAPPSVTPVTGLTRQQGSGFSTAVIATVSDDQTPAGNLLVSAFTPTGISFTSIQNNNGSITATIAAGCGATPGQNTVTLRVTDGEELTTTANLVLNVLPNTAPVLSAYPDSFVPLGGATALLPGAPPHDNGAFIITTQTPGFTGTLSVNQSTGRITIGNAGPVGTFTVTMTATDLCGVSSSSSFNLTVSDCVAAGAEAPRLFASGGNDPRDVAVADFDSDGQLDVVAANFDSNNAAILFNTSHSTFDLSGPANLSLVASPVAVLTTDFNNDGKADLAVISNPPVLEAQNDGGSGAVSILNNGNGTFAPPVSYPVGNNPVAIASADFNGDGKADIATANAAASTVSLLPGIGNGSFGAASTFNVGMTPVKLAVGDFNGDHKPDLAVANSGSNNVSLLLNDGSGGFHLAVNISAGNRPVALVTGDFNGDGKADIVTANQAGKDLSLLSGKGDGTFAAPVSIALNHSPAAIAVSDFNSDGNADLAIASPELTSLAMLFGSGTGGFIGPIKVVTGAGHSSVIAADINRDGRPDLIATDETNHKITVVLNACSTITSLTVTSLSPSSVPAATGETTLTVNGTNFQNGFAVLWNGQTRPTTWVSATQLQATVPASDLASAGTARVAVLASGFSGIVSNELTFTINNPVPVLSALNVSAVLAGVPAFTLNVTGSGFVSGSTISFNGVARQTTFISPTQLTTQVTAADLASAHIISVTVANPTPGGGTSGTLSLTVNNPVPALSGISPTSVFAGNAAFTLTVDGTNFVNGSQVRWNGQGRVTNFVSATRLTAQITAADIASGGTASVTAFNPAPGGGVSGALSFTINDQADLTVSQSFTPNPVGFNQLVTWTIRVTNNGPGPAPTVTVTDDLPGAVDFVSCSATNGGVCGGSGLKRTVSFDLLNAGTTATITLTGRVKCSGLTQPMTSGSALENVASVSSARPDPASGNNVSRAGLTLVQSQMKVNFSNPHPEFGPVPARRETATNAPFTEFTIENPGCLPLFLTLAVKRTGADVSSGKISSTDDRVTFPLYQGTSATPLSAGQIISVSGGQTSAFRVAFDPRPPVPAGRTSGLAAQQVIPDLITSSLLITPVDEQQNVIGNVVTIPLTGHVSTGVRLINPLAAGLAPLVVLQKSGEDEFTVECSIHDPNLTANLIRYQFLDGSGRPLLQPPDIALNLAAAGLVRGQSFTVVKKFTGARNMPQVQRVQVIVYDNETTDSEISAPIGTGTGRVVNVSAANFNPASIAAESIAAAFGEKLSTTTATATTLPLPTSLAGTRVFVTDSENIEREAALFFVSPQQINYLIPAGTAPGSAKVVVASADGALSLSTMQVASLAPSLFSANASGSGPAAALALRVSASGTQSFEAVAEHNGSTFVTRPIDFGPERGPQSDQLYLVLFGTGIRHYHDSSTITARIGGADVEVLYAGPQGGFAGLDQVNLRLPRELAGSGETDIVLMVDGHAANIVRVAFQ